MPLLSAFTPLGLLRLQSLPSEAQKIYNQLIASLGKGNYATQPGAREEAWCYATARALGVARLTLIHAGLQIRPDSVYEYLADREAEWGIVPGPNDSIIVRRQTLAARELLPNGASRGAIVAALQTLLGSDFYWYRTTAKSDIVTWPLAGGAQPQNLQVPTIERKLYKLITPVSFNLGTGQTVVMQAVDPSEPAILVGDSLVLDPGDISRAETVKVTGVTPIFFAFGFALGVTAVYNNPHSAGRLATTMPYPAWVSTQRVDVILVSAAAAVDPEKRRKLNELLERALRGVSTWYIAAVNPGSTTVGGTAGPLVLGVSPLGATPFGLITYPP